MYRLCKFYASDIAAGGNILRNAYFPICREDEQADHGVIFAANGTCKTTLISFLLSVFCPNQDRFVQHLQSGGDKTLQQYLIPGRPAIVLLDLTTTLEQNLFEQEPQEHLVIGQLFYRHRNSSQRPDRLFFIAQSPELFEAVSEKWNDLVNQKQPYASVRDFLIPQVHQTTSQKEWEDKLESIGLDPWLVNRQINFARSEGGIKDAFRFRSESEFLEFFLGCVTDINIAKKLRDETDRCLGKMKDRPEKKARLRAIRSLKKHMEDFDETAGHWRNARASVDLCRIQLGEAAHLLKQILSQAQQLKNDAREAHEKAGEKRKLAQKDHEIAQADILKVNETELTQKSKELQERVRQLSESIERCQGERHALKAGDLMAQINKFKKQIRIKEQALIRSDSEMEPLRQEVNRLAAQYHIRLDHERGEIQKAIQSTTEYQSKAKEERIRCRRHINELEEQRSALNERIIKLKSRLEAAEEARKNLHGEPLETPLEIRMRLVQKLKGIENDLADIKEKIETINGRLIDEKSRWQTLQTKRVEDEGKLKEARQKRDGEREERARLLQDVHLRTVSGSAQFEPTSAGLVTSLGEAINRNSLNLGKKESEQRRLKEELDRLQELHTVAVDRETHKLISHYRNLGFSPAEIRAFPEYLASLNDDSKKIAAFIHGDPGRFTGVMALNEDVIQRVKELEVPPWLKRPVIISLPCSIEDVDVTAHHVIAPKDSWIYTRDGSRRLETDLIKSEKRLNEEISSIVQKVESMKESERHLLHYRKIYPDRSAVDSLSFEVETAKQVLEKRLADIKDFEKKSELIQNRKSNLENQQGSLRTEQVRQREWLRNVENWLGQYGQWESWEKEVSEKEQHLVALDGQIREATAKEESLREEEQKLANMLSGQKEKLKHLNDRAEDVPSPGDVDLDKLSRNDALGQDLKTLRKLYEEARETQRRKSSQLGIKILEKELDQLQEDHQKKQNELERFKQNHVFNLEDAKKWTSQSENDREEQKDFLEKQEPREREEKAHSEVEAKHCLEKLEDVSRQLKMMGKRGIHPEVSDELLLSRSPGELRLAFENKKACLQKEIQRLEEQIPILHGKYEAMQSWCHSIDMAIAITDSYEPCWDDHSPRTDWPDLLSPEYRESNCQIMYDKVKELTREEKNKAVEAKAFRKAMGTLFERLWNDIRNEELEKKLPTIIDELKHHDADSLGTQSQELIERCGHIAQNIEGDLTRSQKLLNTHINLLLEHAKDCHQKMQSASRVTIPENVFIYGGKPILRSGTRLDFNRLNDAFRKSLENWMEELIQQSRCPQVNAMAGNCLGAELLYRLLRTSTAKEEFGIRLLKCDDTARNYEPVGKDLGSGGEALTTSVLLYSLLVSMRLKRYNRKTDRIPAFLILDNPLGVCNRPEFLDAQLKVAKALGIQCVYLTGINDTGSIELFEHRVIIRKERKHLSIDGVPYEKLQIMEMNVER